MDWIAIFTSRWPALQLFISAAYNNQEVDWPHVICVTGSSLIDYVNTTGQEISRKIVLLYSSCSPVNPVVTMRLKYDVSILVCHVRCPLLPSCSVVNNSSPLVYYWSTSCMDDLCCVFPVYSSVVLWLAVCPRTFLIRGQTTWDVSFLSVRRLSRVGLLFFWFLHCLSCLALWHPAFSSGSSFPWSVTSAHLLFSLSSTLLHIVKQA